MSVRFRVLLAGVAMVLLATLITTFYVADHQRGVYRGEVKERAHLLLAALSAPCVSALSQNHIEDLDRVVDEFKNRMGETAGVQSVAVLDAKRRVVGHTHKGEYGRILSDAFSIYASETSSPTFQFVGEGRERSVRVGYPLTTAIEGLEGIRWGTLVATLDLSGEADVVGRLIWRSMRVMLLFALLTGLLLYFVAERVWLRPILTLSQAVDRLRGGDLSARAHIKGRTELARLGAHVDDMAAELERHTHSLQEMVRERTDDLHKANDELTETTGRLKRANEKLKQLARTDSLTGLPNRRHLKETLAFYFELARRGGRPLSFAMIDVDHFKHYNDTHGHPEGDRVLQELATILRHRLRQTDVPSRYGGEEFAVLFLDTTLGQASEVAQALVKRVAYHDFPHGQSQPGGCLSISIGVAELGPDMQDAMDLVSQADQALYRAKNEGRNRVALHNPKQPTKE